MVSAAVRSSVLGQQQAEQASPLAEPAKGSSSFGDWRSVRPHGGPLALLVWFNLAAYRAGPSGWGRHRGLWASPTDGRGKQKRRKFAAMLVNISVILGFWG